MINIPRKLSLAEMYSGPGGLALGAKRAKIVHKGEEYKFEHKWVTDYDPDTCETFRRNLASISNVDVFCSDIRDLTIKNLPPANGFMFGFPCNDFSLVGETRGLNGKFGPLYSYGVKYIEHSEPFFFLAENVGGLSSANGGAAFEKIIYELKNAGRYGYNITSHLYKFENYGVPQARHRYVIIGFRKDLNKFFKVPKPSKIIKSAGPAISKPIGKNVTNHEFTKQSARVIERLKYIKPGQNAWTADIPDQLKLNVKGAKLSQIYKRLVYDKPSYTVTGSGGGGTHIYHWEDNRSLTNRERARLQTFPDDFIFVGGKESVRKQIGMAVPPIAAQKLLIAVLKSLIGIEYKSVEPNHNYFS